MRLLLPLLVIAAAGGAYFVLRSDPSSPADGAGPEASMTSPDGQRAPADLAGGSETAPARTTSAAAEQPPAVAVASTPANAAPVDGKAQAPEHVPEPTFVNGVTADPVGTSTSVDLDGEFETKYRDVPPLERAQALETLRVILANQSVVTDKDVQSSLESLKHEKSWLESNPGGR